MSISNTPQSDAVDQLENDFDGFFEFLTAPVSPPAQKPAVKSLAVPASGLVGNPTVYREFGRIVYELADIKGMLPRECYQFFRLLNPCGCWVSANDGRMVAELGGYLS